LQVARLGLRRGDVVAVQVEAVAVDATVDRPRLVVLGGGRVRVAVAERVVPRDEALVAVGVRADVDESHAVLQDVERRRLVRRGELIDDLHHRLERRRLVAVDRVGEPHVDGRGGDEPLRLVA
jgi:hypothetical protein